MLQAPSCPASCAFASIAIRRESSWRNACFPLMPHLSSCRNEWSLSGFVTASECPAAYRPESPLLQYVASATRRRRKSASRPSRRSNFSSDPLLNKQTVYQQNAPVQTSIIPFIGANPPSLGGVQSGCGSAKDPTALEAPHI